jgi:hypothetical protein
MSVLYVRIRFDTFQRNNNEMRPLGGFVAWRRIYLYQTRRL